MIDRGAEISGMDRRARRAATAVLAVALATLQPPPASAAFRPCQAKVREQLERMDIDAGEVRSTSVSSRTRSRRGGNRVIGFDAWVGLKSCEGSLVLRLNRSCRLKDAYSRGECRLPDLPHH